MRVKTIKLILILGLLLSVLNYCSDDDGNEVTDGGSDLSNANDLSNNDDLSNTNDEATSNDLIENDFSNTEDIFVNDLDMQDSCHVLVINGRETNSPLDKFIITNDPLFSPQ